MSHAFCDQSPFDIRHPGIRLSGYKTASGHEETPKNGTMHLGVIMMDVSPPACACARPARAALPAEPPAVPPLRAFSLPRPLPPPQHLHPARSSRGPSWVHGAHAELADRQVMHCCPEGQ